MANRHGADGGGKEVAKQKQKQNHEDALRRLGKGAAKAAAPFSATYYGSGKSGRTLWLALARGAVWLCFSKTDSRISILGYHAASHRTAVTIALHPDLAEAHDSRQTAPRHDEAVPHFVSPFNRSRTMMPCELRFRSLGLSVMPHARPNRSGLQCFR